MEGQMSIGPTALDAVHVQIAYRLGHGWDVVIGSRRNGESWSQADRRGYDYLTTEELADVLHQEVERLFG